MNYRDRKMEEDLKDLITRTWAWFVRIESNRQVSQTVSSSKFQITKKNRNWKDGNKEIHVSFRESATKQRRKKTTELRSERYICAAGEISSSEETQVKDCKDHKLCYLPNKAESFFYVNFLLQGESSYLSISKSFSSTDKRNRLISHLNTFRESLSLKVNFFEITILFQRLGPLCEL